MAKAKPAGKSAASAKAKKGVNKRKRKDELVDDPPIIVKGGALPTEEEGSEGHTLVIDAHNPANSKFHPEEFYRAQYSYSAPILPEIVTIELYVNGEIICEKKVEGTSWEIRMYTS